MVARSSNVCGSKRLDHTQRWHQWMLSHEMYVLCIVMCTYRTLIEDLPVKTDTWEFHDPKPSLETNGPTLWLSFCLSVYEWFLSVQATDPMPSVSGTLTVVLYGVSTVMTAVVTDFYCSSVHCQHSLLFYELKTLNSYIFLLLFYLFVRYFSKRFPWLCRGGCDRLLQQFCTSCIVV